MQDDSTKPLSRARAVVPISVAASVGRPSSTTVPSLATRRVLARSLFDKAPEVQRPRLVLFVGAPSAPYASVAALWFAALAAERKATVVLACTDGPARLSPEIVAAAEESGLDVRRLIARSLTPDLLAAADLIITLSTGRRAGVKLPKTVRRKEHWTITEPRFARAKGSTKPGSKTTTKTTAKTRATASQHEAMSNARRLRDTLRARVAMLVFSEGWGRPEISREEARVTRAKVVGTGLIHATGRRSAADRPVEIAHPFVVARTSAPPWFARSSLS
jgi:protein-tyrosine-phosphatase